MTRETGNSRAHARGDEWTRRGCALVVAGVAAYSSYAHQRQFALAGGADEISAALWPLSVDGLVILASLGLVRSQSAAAVRARLALWVAFLLGVAVSLAANIAAAPTLGWQPVLVAGWPPLALLLAVELVVHARTRQPDTTGEPVNETHSLDPVETTTGADAIGMPAIAESAHAGPRSSRAGRRGARRTAAAETVMWAHFDAERQAGRTPTGAELDRVAGTNNYGRAVLARWRRTGRIPAEATP